LDEYGAFEVTIIPRQIDNLPYEEEDYGLAEAG
jgi:hypothetical protein